MDAQLLSRLPALLDRRRSGVLWVSHLGLVHPSNAEAMCRTGVRTGDLPPGHLLRQAWSDVAGLARTRAIQVGCGQPPAGAVLAPLYGHGPGLRRMLRDGLRAALYATAPGGRLRVDDRQAGARAPEVFVACARFAGVPAGHRPAGAGQRRSHGPLDWHLCRRTLALHGAQRREAHDGDARNVMIDLPCGAPLQINNAGIATEQARRFAHDLSALRARNRRLTAQCLPPATQGAGLPA